MATHPDPGNGPVDRIPPTGQLTVTQPLSCIFAPEETLP
jgi:hypothetical protein